MSLLREFKIFLSYPKNMRNLLTTNFIYAFATPIYYSFIAMYILRNTHGNLILTMSNQMANYTGTVIVFVLNGFATRIIPVKYLYSLGMLLSGVSLMVMVSLKELDFWGVTIAGALVGISMGLFWANRDYLALASTTDENRNYYYGLENFLATICSFIVPITTGWFVAGTELYGWFGGNRNNAYSILAIVVVVIASLASIIVCRGKFLTPEPTKYLYLKYHPLWYKVLFMEGLRGLGQGFMVVAPSMLLVKLIGGQEGTLGIIQTTGAILLGVVFYLAARMLKPENRIWIMLIGLSSFAIGCICNAILFSTVGVLVFIACQIIGTAFIEYSFSPVLMLVIDILSKKEKRNKYAYLCSNEIPVYIGRLIGGLLFIAAGTYISDVFALRYVLMVIGILEFFSYFLCKQVLATCKEMDAELTEHDLRTEPHSIADIISADER